MLFDQLKKSVILVYFLIISVSVVADEWRIRYQSDVHFEDLEGHPIGSWYDPDENRWFEPMEMVGSSVGQLCEWWAGVERRHHWWSAGSDATFETDPPPPGGKDLRVKGVSVSSDREAYCSFEWWFPPGRWRGWWRGVRLTKIEPKKCPQPYVYNEAQSRCEAYCSSGESWDSEAEQCVSKPEAEDCKTKSENPIDFLQGRKYRSEMIIQSGVKDPFRLKYYFNNQRNQEKTPAGSRVAVVPVNRYLAATKPPLAASQYQSAFTSRGVPVGSTVYKANQYYGSVDRYWRHNFDEVLQVQGSQYIFHAAKGYEVIFAGFGTSRAYPNMNLQPLSESEEAFTGFKITNYQSGEVKKFDSDGRLMEIHRGPLDVLTLSYDNQNRLERIINREGAFIQLVYQELTADSIYSVASTDQSYPITVSNDRGESAQITWGKSYQGQIGEFDLITQISESTAGEGGAARAFEYNDPRFGASLTDIFFIADVTQEAREPLFHFEYDEQGRAVYSGTVAQGGSDSVEYVDEHTRVVTNALGKKAVYEFADISGALRLKRVTGEPTQNCVKSEVEYLYDAAGNVSQKIENGSTTQYAYDGQNREIERTEAAGTPEARTITTEYHPTLNKPVKITEPGKITTMTYDAEGRLLSNTTQSTAAP